MARCDSAESSLEDGSHRALLWIYLELWPKYILKLAKIRYFSLKAHPIRWEPSYLLGRIWSLSAKQKAYVNFEYGEIHYFSVRASIISLLGRDGEKRPGTMWPQARVESSELFDSIHECLYDLCLVRGLVAAVK